MNRKQVWRAANLDKAKATDWKNHLRKYGITPEVYETMLIEQRGVCAICGGVDSRKLAVDHCHSTGRVRGLLCGTCNRGLGNFRDSTELLERAKGYLSAGWG